MAEIIGDHAALGLPEHVGLYALRHEIGGGVGQEGDPGEGREGAVEIDDAVPVFLQQSPLDADVFVPARLLFVVTILPAVLPEIEGSVIVPAEELPHAVGVVIVGVGEDAEFHLGQVHPQGVGVGGEQRSRPGVQKDLVPLVLDIDGKPPFGLQAAVGDIVGQNDGAHRAALLSGLMFSPL